METDLEYLR